MLPNFLIAGAARCGTTSLYYYLKQHPEISFPKLKEPKYFSSLKRQFPQNGIGDENIDRYIIKDFTAYEALFSTLSNKRVGEASPDYLYYSKYTAKYIKQMLGDIPIIILIRNPIERAKSAYKYLTRENREHLPFPDALDAEEERLVNNWDFMWAYKSYGLYFQNIMHFKSIFTNVSVILYEEFISDKERTLKGIFNFLGVDDKIRIDTKMIHNPSGKPNLIGKMVLDRQSRISTVLREVLKRTVPRKYLEYVANKTMKEMHINNSVDSDLQVFYKGDVNNLSQLLQKDMGYIWFGN